MWGSNLGAGYNCTRHGGAPYPNSCNLPSGKPDYDHPNINVVAATRYTDMVLYKFVDPLPSEIPNMVFLDSTFIEKYFLQDCSSYSTPEECSRNTHYNRTFLTLDGVGRPILSTMSFYDYTPIGVDNSYNVTRRMSDTCVDAGSSEQVFADHIQINRANITSVAGNSIPSLLDQGSLNYNQNISKLSATDPSDTKDRITKDYSSAFSSTYNLFDGENPFLLFEPDPPSGYSPVLQNIDDHLKTEIAMMNAYPYDVRDFESTAFSGLSAIQNDSSSVSLFPIPNADGSQGGRWALFGIQNTTDNIGDFWHRFNMKSAINAIYEEYQNEGAIPSTEYPTYICAPFSTTTGKGNEFVDFSEYSISSSASMGGEGASQSPSTIPTLGYKVFKSTAGQNGPWTDITEQLVTYETDDLDSAVTTGVPCLDLSKDESGNFSTPCYTKSTQFVDDQVLQGETYYYYISGLDTSASTPYYTETQKSQVLQITVPEKSEYSPRGDKVYIDRTSASNGAIIGQQNAAMGSGIIHPDEYGTRGQGAYMPIKILKGYNAEIGGNDLNIPLFGFDNSLGASISPRPEVNPETGVGNIFYDIVVSDDDPSYDEAGDQKKGGNDGEILGHPLPFDNSSYQYMMGKKYTESSPNARPNNLLQMYSGDDADQLEAFNNFKNRLDTLALSRFNRSDQQTLEPYFHSELYEVFNNLRTIIMNPSHYGNYRDYESQTILWDSGTQIAGDDSTYVPYWSGKHLTNDILSPYELETVIIRDAKVVDDDMKTIEWMSLEDVGLRNNVKYIDISNNGIYRLRHNPSAIDRITLDIENLEHFDCSNNNIGSDSDGSRALFLNDTSIPVGDRNFGTTIRLNSVQTSKLKYCNVSNNPDLIFKFDELGSNGNINERTFDNLEYLDVSNTKSVGTQTWGPTGVVGQITRSPYIPVLKYLYMNDSTSSDTAFANTVNMGTPISLDTLHMKGSEVTSIGVGEGNAAGTNPQACFGFDSLREIDISESNIEVLNLQYSQISGGWETRGFPLNEEEDNPSYYGTTARNTEIIRAKNATSLRRIYLPNKEYDSASGTCPFANDPRYLKILDLSGTSLGDTRTINGAAKVDGSLSYLFLRGYVATLAQVDQYPEGHTLTIDISGVTDENGNLATLDKYIYCLYDYLWSSRGLNLNIVYESGQIIEDDTCSLMPWFNCSLCGG